MRPRYWPTTVRRTTADVPPFAPPFSPNVTSGFSKRQIDKLIIEGCSMTQTMSKTMKTVAIDRFGGLNEMKIRELPMPELDADEILVRVEAAGVGVWDPFEREGHFAEEFNMSPKFPIILGS